MSKWVFLGFTMAVGLGVGAWLVVDPNAKATVATAWSQGTHSFNTVNAEVNVQGIWAPIASAFRDFANSVSALWSAPTVQIQVPNVQIP
jgi:predicted ATP-grasp superfamily ATP-dependent carboligase